MKIRILFASVLLGAILTGCVTDNGRNSEKTEEGEYGYISLTIRTPYGSGTRASSEQTATVTENTVSTIYAITFDSRGRVVAYGSEPTVITLSNFDSSGNDTALKPAVFKVSNLASNILLIANPGPEMAARFDAGNVVEGAYFDDLNAEIVDSSAATPAWVDVTEINSAGFTMINCDGLVAIDNIYLVGDQPGQYTDDQAQDMADKNRTTVNIERLTSKVTFGTADPVEVDPDAEFTFTSWTLDVINGNFYPYAEKIDITSGHTGTVYQDNFYTIDPNYDGYLGLSYNNVKTAQFTNKDESVYCIENTILAQEQKHQNATRVVVKGTYYPDNTWTGDWFAYAGDTYGTFADLQTAYADTSKKNLRDACDRFFGKVKADQPTITATKFPELIQEDLDLVSDGGDLVKEDKCIQWYQNGVNYYYYVIKHDNENTASMAQGKYGVVRNNWYSLTLTKVSAPGTPWYPSVDPNEPGDPDGPQPPDPIDEMEGYIGVVVNVAPWIYWQNNVEF